MIETGEKAEDEHNAVNIINSILQKYDLTQAISSLTPEIANSPVGTIKRNRLIVNALFPNAPQGHSIDVEGNPLITADEYERLQSTPSIPLGNRSYSAVEILTAFRIIEHSLAAPKMISYKVGMIRHRERVKVALWDPVILKLANLEALQPLLVNMALFLANHNKLEFNEDQLPGISGEGWEKQATSNMTNQVDQLQGKLYEWSQLLYDLPGKEFCFFPNGEFGRLFPPRVDPELEAKLQENPNQYGLIFLDWLWGRQEIPPAFKKREVLLDEIRHKTGLNVVWVEGDRQFRIDAAMKTENERKAAKEFDMTRRTFLRGLMVGIAHIATASNQLLSQVSEIVVTPNTVQPDLGLAKLFFPLSSYSFIDPFGFEMQIRHAQSVRYDIMKPGETKLESIDLSRKAFDQILPGLQKATDTVQQMIADLKKSETKVEVIKRLRAHLLSFQKAQLDFDPKRTNGENYYKAIAELVNASDDQLEEIMVERIKDVVGGWKSEAENEAKILKGAIRAYDEYQAQHSQDSNKSEFQKKSPSVISVEEVRKEIQSKTQLQEEADLDGSIKRWEQEGGNLGRDRADGAMNSTNVVQEELRKIVTRFQDEAYKEMAAELKVSPITAYKERRCDVGARVFAKFLKEHHVSARRISYRKYPDKPISATNPFHIFILADFEGRHWIIDPTWQQPALLKGKQDEEKVLILEIPTQRVLNGVSFQFEKLDKIMQERGVSDLYYVWREGIEQNGGIFLFMSGLFGDDAMLADGAMNVDLKRYEDWAEDTIRKWPLKKQRLNHFLGMGAGLLGTYGNRVGINDDVLAEYQRLLVHILTGEGSDTPEAADFVLKNPQLYVKTLEEFRDKTIDQRTWDVFPLRDKTITPEAITEAMTEGLIFYFNGGKPGLLPKRHVNEEVEAALAMNHHQNIPFFKEHREDILRKLSEFLSSNLKYKAAKAASGILEWGPGEASEELIKEAVERVHTIIIEFKPDFNPPPGQYDPFIPLVYAVPTFLRNQNVFRQFDPKYEVLEQKVQRILDESVSHTSLPENSSNELTFDGMNMAIAAAILEMTPDRKGGRGNAAMNTNNNVVPINGPGGIDLNQIKVKRTGKTIHVQFDQAQLSALERNNFKGFTPVITGFRYIQSPWRYAKVS